MSDKNKHLVLNIDKSVAGSVLNEFAKQVNMAKNKPEIDRVSKFKEVVDCLESVCTILDDLDLTKESDKIMAVLESVIAKHKKEETAKKDSVEKDLKSKKKKEASELSNPTVNWEMEVQNAKAKISSFLKNKSK